MGFFLKSANLTKLKNFRFCLFQIYKISYNQKLLKLNLKLKLYPISVHLKTLKKFWKPGKIKKKKEVATLLIQSIITVLCKYALKIFLMFK